MQFLRMNIKLIWRNRLVTHIHEWLLKIKWSYFKSSEATVTLYYLLMLLFDITLDFLFVQIYFIKNDVVLRIPRTQEIRERNIPLGPQGIPLWAYLSVSHLEHVQITDVDLRLPDIISFFITIVSGVSSFWRTSCDFVWENMNNIEYLD